MKRRFRSRLPAPKWLQRRRLAALQVQWADLQPLFEQQREYLAVAIERCAEMTRETDALLVRLGLKVAA